MPCCFAVHRRSRTTFTVIPTFCRPLTTKNIQLDLSIEAPNAVLALGANLGNRLLNIRDGLCRLAKSRIEVLRYSRLYESAAAYVTEQPAFLNAAIAVRTTLSPESLLAAVKDIEAKAGRDFKGQRWGPRPLDIDIIFHESSTLQSERLELPHPRWQERDFVKAPVADLYTDVEMHAMRGAIQPSLCSARDMWERAGGEAQLGRAELRCVLAMGQRLGSWPWQGRTRVMGVLNVTPDSFSDGGLSLHGPSAALARARALLAAGADVIDLGGQSTRPGAELVGPEEEAARVLPVLEALRDDEAFAGVPISIDTFHSYVASQAAASGADIINDVSGGRMDPAMHATVAESGLSYVLMHMRGDPQTMQSVENTSYPPGELAAMVGRELQVQADAAVRSGIEPWRLILDPGIGFAKSREGNCELIRDLRLVKQQLTGCLKGQPMLVGPSRKAFLGWLTGKPARERDTASAVAAGLCIGNGAQIIRMHDTAAGRDAVAVADGIAAGALMAA